MTLNITMQESEELQAVFNDESMQFEADFGQTSTVVADDHRKLTFRDAPDQHPIGAITRLQSELDVRSSEAMTNLDIATILQA